MSADVLRRAAALMRERAEPLLGVEWFEPDDGSMAWALKENTGTRTPDQDVQYIASWHPVVALAVADWLDDQLDAYLHVRPGNHLSTQKALAVARAYLGEQP